MQSLLVDVITDNVKNNPQCFHGPTLLFRRRGTTKSEYYACSACRDRSVCSFYIKKADVHSNKQSERAVKERQEVLAALNEKEFKKLRKLIKAASPSSRGYCHTCNKLFLTSQSKEHTLCKTVIGISDHQLAHPTEICMPRENNKMEAQYLFSDETVLHLLSILKSMKVKRTLCIGTPRLHEGISNAENLNIMSLLLDIDPKYHYFYPKSKFVWYNMFNNFVMDEKQKQTLLSFLTTKEDIAIILDPPFGGRVEPIAATLSRLTADCNNLNCGSKKELYVIWFFPYFMERHIKESLPTYKMLDYQVNYENHASFSDTGSRSRKAGSPVRIFTNIPLRLFDLSSIPGYRHCDLCGYWVSISNEHCPDCQSCTSKNGMRYIHCKKCKKCVKPSYSHCDTCQRCCLTSHICGQFQPDPNCYHCHQPGHKKVQCPMLNDHKRKKRKIKS